MNFEGESLQGMQMLASSSKKEELLIFSLKVLWMCVLVGANM